METVRHRSSTGLGLRQGHEGSTDLEIKTPQWPQNLQATEELTVLSENINSDY